jgi:hypothetical protein
MASGFSHAFAAVVLGKVYTGAKMHWRFWALAIASAVLPDGHLFRSFEPHHVRGVDGDPERG